MLFRNQELDERTAKAARASASSALPDRVQRLIELIFDTNMMRAEMIQMQVGAAMSPLPAALAVHLHGSVIVVVKH